MGKIILPAKAKLFIGVIAINSISFSDLKDILTSNWGEIDLESEVFKFDKTNYYENEMGKDLIKKFFSFKKLIERENLPEIKLRTNQIEKEFKINKNKEGRDINLDPGYITLSSVVLATTKDYRHRIYHSKGIYLENTLYYDSKKKSYTEWDWTYPDYRQDSYKEFFNRMREIYHNQLKYGEEFNMVD